MHIVIIGAGGVGGLFGGKLAKSNQKVSILARGAHLEAIQKNGLHVKSIEGDFYTQNIFATDKINEIPLADLILICTKSWQVTNAAKLILPILKENTVVIPLQNGADNVDKLVAVLERKHILGGLCKVYSKIEAPGIISHFGHPPEIIFGELSNTTTERAKQIKSIFDTAKINNRISNNIFVDIWNKFMFIAPLSALGALTRSTIGEMLDQPALKKMLQELITEMHQIAIAKGIHLHESSISNILSFIEKQPYQSTTSTQRDLMEGRPSELHDFNGFIVREGIKLGVKTPVNHFVYHCLLPMEIKARNK